MALDFDLDGSFNDDDEELESTQDFDDDFDPDDEDEDGTVVGTPAYSPPMSHDGVVH